MLLVNSAASAVLPALRTHTPIRCCEFATVGVQLKVFDVDQLVITVHFNPSCIRNLNWCGAAPPVGTEVNVIVVPAGCGAGRSAVNERAVKRPPEVVVVGGGVVVVGGGVVVVGGGGVVAVPLIAKSALFVASPASAV